MYSLGYFAGIIFIGKYLMDPWEQLVYVVMLGSYLVQTMVRKRRQW